jgi:hypothetical protein
MQRKNLKCKALILSLVFPICLNFGSLGARVDDSAKFEKRTLKWRLIKNPKNESGANKAAFIFIDNGIETIKGSKMLEYFLAPKLFAFADNAWSNAPIRESECNISKPVNSIWAAWADIASQIGQREFSRLDFLFDGYHCRIAPPGAVIEDGLLKAKVTFSVFAIRYTEDGSEPGVNAKEYTNTIKVRSFNKFGRASKTFIVK